MQTHQLLAQNVKWRLTRCIIFFAIVTVTLGLAFTQAAQAAPVLTTKTIDATENIGLFLGHWVNQDPHTDGITRVTIREEGDDLIIHMWGSCTPIECDWGDLTIAATEDDDGLLELTWVQSFATRSQTLILLPDGRLQVRQRTHFTDDSGRPDYDWVGTFIRDGGPIAYVYQSDEATAKLFWGLLASNGFADVDLIPVEDVLTTDFNPYSLVIIAHDTGYLGNWGDSAGQVDHINNNTSCLLGLGEGGYAFFGQLDLDIGYPYGWHWTESLDSVISAQSYIAPIGSEITLYTNPVDHVGIHVPEPVPGITVFGTEPTSPLHAPLVMQEHYLFWGYVGAPDVMTIDGQQLFVRGVDAAMNEECIPSSSGSIITVIPEEIDLFPNEVVTASIVVSDITALYGTQLELSYDPDVIEIVDAYDFAGGTQIQHGSFLTAETTIKNVVDPVNGTIHFAISLQGAEPGANGSGTLAQFAIKGLVTGSSPISLTNVVLSDPQSQAISYTAQSGQVIVKKPVVDITGYVALERRTSNAGVDICIDTMCTTTRQDGSYEFLDAPTTGTISVMHQSYLSTTRPYSGNAGRTINLPTVTLLGGDVIKDVDHTINIRDAARIGLSWNKVRTDANWRIADDVTDDSVVDIRDMVAIQYNWQAQAPNPWDAVLARRMARTKVTRQPAQVATQSGTSMSTQTKLNVVPAQGRMTELGDTMAVELWVEDVTNLYATDLVLSFDPNVVQVRDVNPLADGIQIGVGEFLDVLNHYLLVNRVDNEAGVIELALTQTAPAQARQGSGVLGVIEFEAMATGSSPLEFVNAELVDDAAVLVDVSVGDSVIEVGQVVNSRYYLPFVVR
ncbi:MAG: cohesin domain-containing protein [Chloroflexota bacterium]